MIDPMRYTIQMVKLLRIVLGAVCFVDFNGPSRPSLCMCVCVHFFDNFQSFHK